MELFFPRIQKETCARMHTKVKLLEGMQMKTILKLLRGDAVKLLGWIRVVNGPSSSGANPARTRK